MFSPKPNIPYKLLFKEIKNSVVVESHMTITFTEENNIYQSERYVGFKPYEGYDNHDNRVVCYLCYINNNSVIINSEADANDSKINSYNITKIYLEDKIIFNISEDL